MEKYHVCLTVGKWVVSGVFHCRYIIIYFFSLKIILVLANSADPGEMPHYEK